MIKRHPERFILLTAVILYAPFLFMGYGSDIDTYRVLHAGRHFVQTLDYIPSRGPGFFVFETIMFFMDQLGGSFLANLTIMGMALIILYGFMRLCREYKIPHYLLLTIALMVHPFFWANAACSMDYLMGIGFAFLGMIQIRRRHYFTAGAAFALGAGSRLTVVLLAGGFLLWQFLIEPQNRWKLIQAGLVFGFFTIVFYLPPADFAQWTTRFLVASVGSQEYWSPGLRFGRWGYKNLMFWSIPGFLLLIGFIIRGLIKSGWESFSRHAWLPAAALLITLVYESFYLGIPTEPSYLIPTIPLVLIVFGIFVGDHRWPVILLTVVLCLSGIVTINIAQPNLGNRATSAEYGFWLEPGHLAALTTERLNYQQCGRPYCNVIHSPIQVQSK
ncbi:hypothetical protein [Leptolinea tardivitalis]|uniref:Glycosyltransferase RgtA/B/C/D-like domain-containing protein n=1 Tax=Leptolinea tardivitalis TaxID=229920 RepID=A0A0P6WUF1_9CHLR|nr:hypothetical protein [Leptolinea tardivitalis]KPL70285.1 hypothetical protein ADM99_14040 [Leptolinea tardivitalis]GAP21837.1 hypothetical protein LTAR_02054 [Leptolinea tardivitalis]